MSNSQSVYRECAQQSKSIVSPLEQGFQRTHNELDILERELGELYTRLTPYLADIPPSKPEGLISASLGSSPILIRMTALCSRIADVVVELNNIKARLEL